jgi:uncharacterized protein YjbI with pentapeptide repeats
MTKITKEQVLENLEDVKKYVNEAESEVEGIAIKNRFTGNVIFTSTKTTWKEAVEEAVENCANLHYANLCGADLRGANLRDANLRGVNLYEANLYEANLYEANLYEANLYEANLRGANLSEANLRGVNLYEANLGGADLRGANLNGAELMNAKFYGKGGTSKLTKKQLPEFLNALGFQVEN